MSVGILGTIPSASPREFDIEQFTFLAHSAAAVRQQQLEGRHRQAAGQLYEREAHGIWAKMRINKGQEFRYRRLHAGSARRHQSCWVLPCKDRVSVARVRNGFVAAKTRGGLRELSSRVMTDDRS